MYLKSDRKMTLSCRSYDTAMYVLQMAPVAIGLRSSGSCLALYNLASAINKFR